MSYTDYIGILLRYYYRPPVSQVGTEVSAREAVSTRASREDVWIKMCYPFSHLNPP